MIGFTPLTEKMSQLGAKGIELMTLHLNNFFDKLIGAHLFLRLLLLFTFYSLLIVFVIYWRILLALLGGSFMGL